jgi:hypothetical protein
MALAAISIALLGYYCFALHLGAIELLRSSVGAVSLWLPLGGWIWIWLRNEARDPVIRLAIAACGTYALTTFGYFVAATAHCTWLFYIAQAVGGAMLLARGLKNWRVVARRRRRGASIDWVLVALVAASMVSNLRVQNVLKHDTPAATVTYSGWHEQLYHIGQAYELDRNVPPLQATIRGGSPERAYHHLSAMTTMLVGRYTGQSDLLRAHFVYHFAALQILMCLLLFGIGKNLTGSRVAGYFVLASMYLVVAPAPVLWPIADQQQNPYFYFTLFPHLSSGLDPVTQASPPMYSGVAVLYGSMLALAVVLRRASSGHEVNVSAILTALLLAAITRFRIHIAVVAVPLFMLLALYMWRRTRRAIFAWSTGIAGVGAVLSYFEMHLPSYIAGTAGVRIGYSGVATQRPFFNSWPFSGQVLEWLHRTIGSPEVLKWTTEVVSLSMFSICNIVGLPLLVASAMTLMTSKSRSLLPLYLFAFASAAASVGCALVISSPYDPYSVGGQLLLHTRWYLFPFGGVAAWMAWRYVYRRAAWLRTVWKPFAAVLLMVGLWYRTAGPLSVFSAYLQRTAITMSEDEWLALLYVRSRTSAQSIVLPSRVPASPFLLSGFGGRAAYDEDPGNPLDQVARQLAPGDDRMATMRALRRATSNDQFCAVLRSTPITHILEFADRPLRVHPVDCLTEVWHSPVHRVTIWQVTKPREL